MIVNNIIAEPTNINNTANCNEIMRNLRTSISIINKTNVFEKTLFLFPDQSVFTFNPLGCDEKPAFQNNITIEFSKKQYFTHYAYSIKYDAETRVLKMGQFSN